jgi:2-methoxy-6-polyprenyl-1,4-benzoquinol methylase
MIRSAQRNGAQELDFCDGAGSVSKFEPHHCQLGSTTMTPVRRGIAAIVSTPCRVVCARCYSAKIASDPTTHFGFRTVPSAQKEQLGTNFNVSCALTQKIVVDVFTSVARKYDTMNDIMSMYTHRLWKDHFVRSLNPGSPNSQMQILDVAGGTGDIAFRLLEHATVLNGDDTAKVKVVDISEKMLRFGRKKVDKGDMKKWAGRVEFQQGNAETLEDVEDNSVDLYTIAFGIRNVTHIDRVLKAAYRVLKPGGAFASLVCLVQIDEY